MAFLTPQLVIVQKALEAQFPGIKFGVYNRRRIANSTSWSQHSWPNALDIFFTHYQDTSPEHQARLDVVARWLWERFQEFNLVHLLWRRKDHYDHIHIDAEPWGVGMPSLVRGGSDNWYRYSDGRTITQAALERKEEQVIQVGDRGAAVVKLQQALLDAGYDLPQYGADGSFGAESASAVMGFQADEGLTPTGVVDGLTAAMLVQGQPGPPGPEGAQGPQGERGPRGKQGEVPDLAGYRLTPVLE